MSKRDPITKRDFAVTATGAIKLSPNTWYDFAVSGNCTVQYECGPDDWKTFDDSTGGSHGFMGKVLHTGRVKLVRVADSVLNAIPSTTPPVNE